MALRKTCLCGFFSFILAIVCFGLGIYVSLKIEGEYHIACWVFGVLFIALGIFMCTLSVDKRYRLGFYFFVIVKMLFVDTTTVMVIPHEKLDKDKGIFY